MKLAVTADWHVDRQTAGHDRWPEVQDFARWFGERATAFGADAIVHLGDFADPGSDELEKVCRITQSVMSLGCYANNVYVVAGNHDVVFGTRQRTMLSPLAMLVRGVNAMGYGDVDIAEVPQTFWESEDVAIIGAPYPFDRVDFALDDGKYWTTLRGCLMRHLEYPGAKLVVCSHLMLDVCERGEESDTMRRGEDCYAPQWLVDRADLWLQGHYHRKQEHIMESGTRVLVPGSPVRNTFGEEDDDVKGAWFVEV